MALVRECYAAAILETLGTRLRTMALDDPALKSLTIVVTLSAGGGYPRSVAVRPEYRDDLPTAPEPVGGYVDSCGPITRRRA